VPILAEEDFQKTKDSANRTARDEYVMRSFTLLFTSQVYYYYYYSSIHYYGNQMKMGAMGGGHTQRALER
jgi:hypothetical protein